MLTAGRSASTPEWTLRIVGLAATGLVTLYLTRLAQRAMREHAPTLSPDGPSVRETQARRAPGVRQAVVAAASFLLLVTSVLAVGCPPLRDEAYVGDRLDAQLASGSDYVHTHDRWSRVEPSANEVHLTALYDWYGRDFLPQAPSVLEDAARQVPALQEALNSGRRPRVRWLDYDWRLNERVR